MTLFQKQCDHYELSAICINGNVSCNATKLIISFCLSDEESPSVLNPGLNLRFSKSICAVEMPIQTPGAYHMLLNDMSLFNPYMAGVK